MMMIDAKFQLDARDLIAIEFTSARGEHRSWGRTSTSRKEKKYSLLQENVQAHLKGKQKYGSHCYCSN